MELARRREGFEKLLSSVALKNLIVIAGPTASGKTSLAIELAQYFKTEIVSCDSRQVYEEMTIGTAKPSTQELNQISHHFISSHSINSLFSAGDFERQGLTKINELFEKFETLVMVGGSGLYVRALCHGLDDFPTVDPSVREQLNQEFEKFGILPLQEELRLKDPQYFAQIDIQNSQRVIRALEICRGTGTSISHFRSNSEAKRDFRIIKIGVDIPREVLYQRINARVDMMMSMGLLEEVKNLHHLKHLNALQTVGYQEFFDFLEEKTTISEAIELVKKNTRNYAKRQITWFNKEPNLIWMSPDVSMIIDYLQNEGVV